MAKLAEVRKRREAAAERAKHENEAEVAAEEERKKAVAAANVREDSDEKKKKKKKSKEDVLPKLDKIAMKKMKPAQMKEALKERGLEIQGNAKTLQQRLLKFEESR